MTRSDARNFVLGFLLMAPVTLWASTTFTWDSARCPAGTATLTATAVSEAGLRTATAAVTFPAATVAVSFANDLPAGSWVITPSVAHRDGRVYGGSSQYLTVLPPVTEPLPTQTPTPCQHTTSGVDLLGHTWTLTELGVVIRDGMYALPRGTDQPGAIATAMSFDRGVVHVRDARDGRWYRRNESTQQFSLSSEPMCSGVPIVLSPAPTSTLKRCVVTLVAVRPPAATGTGWTMRFFEGLAPLSLPVDGTTADVTVLARPYLITAIWEKTGEPSLASLPVTVECAFK